MPDVDIVSIILDWETTNTVKGTSIISTVMAPPTPARQCRPPAPD